MIRRRVVMRGEVQGVFFRDGLRKEAERRGLSGWARNAEDGSVEAEVEGAEEEVAALVAWCEEGPPRAQVGDVTVEEREPVGEEGFKVR